MLFLVSASSYFQYLFNCKGNSKTHQSPLQDSHWSVWNLDQILPYNLPLYALQMVTCEHKLCHILNWPIFYSYQIVWKWTNGKILLSSQKDGNAFDNLMHFALLKEILRVFCFYFSPLWVVSVSNIIPPPPLPQLFSDLIMADVLPYCHITNSITICFIVTYQLCSVRSAVGINQHPQVMFIVKDSLMPTVKAIPMRNKLMLPSGLIRSALLSPVKAPVLTLQLGQQYF